MTRPSAIEYRIPQPYEDRLSDAKTAARGANVHVELIDLERFITLWREFYHKLTDEDKNRLPLLPIYFLAPPTL